MGQCKLAPGDELRLGDHVCLGGVIVVCLDAGLLIVHTCTGDGVIAGLIYCLPNLVNQGGFWVKFGS